MPLVKRYVTKFTSGARNDGFVGALFGYWPLQEPSGIAYDFRRANNLANVNVAPSVLAGGPGGAYPNAFSYTRTSTQYHEVADNADLSTGDIDFAGSVYVRLTSKPAGDMHIFGKWQAAGNNREYLLYWSQSTDRLQFIVSADGINNGGIATASTLGAPTIGVWYRVDFYHWAGGNEVGIQINAGTINTAVHNGGVFNGTAPFRIGASGDGNPFDGRAAGGWIVKGGIPSQPERLAMHNNGVPVSPLSITHFDVNEAGISFPLTDYEYQSSQPLRDPVSTISGANYAYRMRGGWPGLKGLGQERVRFTFVGDGAAQDAFDTALNSGTMNPGLGRLWSVGDDGSERWCWAALANRAEFEIRTPASVTPVVLVFNRFSDWFDKYSTRLYFDTGNTGDTFITANAIGTAPIFDARVTLYADSWVNPLFNNSPLWFGNRYLGVFTTLRDIAASSQRILVDGGAPFYGWSTDNGVTYGNDIGNVGLQSNQYLITILVPGGNLFQFQGTRANSRALIEFFNHWHT